MALQLEYTTAQGFYCSAAYARIRSFSGDKNFTQLTVELHKDVAARANELQPITTFSISLPIADGGNLTQMYTALKSDSNFTNAVDC
jgi:hypothetical protein